MMWKLSTWVTTKDIFTLYFLNQSLFWIFHAVMIPYMIHFMMFVNVLISGLVKSRVFLKTWNLDFVIEFVSNSFLFCPDRLESSYWHWKWLSKCPCSDSIIITRESDYVFNFSIRVVCSSGHIFWLWIFDPLQDLKLQLNSHQLARLERKHSLFRFALAVVKHHYNLLSPSAQFRSMDNFVRILHSLARDIPQGTKQFPFSNENCGTLNKNSATHCWKCEEMFETELDPESPVLLFWKSCDSSIIFYLNLKFAEHNCRVFIQRWIVC